MLLWQRLLAQQVAAAVAYRYWRIYVTLTDAGAGSGGVQINEIELRATVGGSDLTTPSTPSSASSTLAPGYGPAQMVNNFLLGAPWASSGSPSVGTPAWARFDLGTAQIVREVAIHPAGKPDEEGSSIGSALYAPRNFIIQGSSDDTNFTDVKAFTGQTAWSNAAFRNFAL